MASELAFLLRFLNKTDGRDKVIRLCQYSTRIAGYKLTRQNPTEFGKSLQGISAACGESRKILRWGKGLSDIQALSQLKESHPLLHLLLRLRHCFNALYMTLDNLVWLSKHKIFTIVDTQRLSKLASFAWLFRLLLSCAIEAIKWSQIAPRYQKLKLDLISSERGRPSTGKTANESYDDDLPALKREFREVQDQLMGHGVALVTAALDVPLALDGTGLRQNKLSPAVSGAFGVSSTLLMIKTLAQKT